MEDNFSCHQCLYSTVVPRNCHLKPRLMVHAYSAGTQEAELGRRLGHKAGLDLGNQVSNIERWRKAQKGGESLGALL